MAWENVLADIDKIKHIIDAWQQSGAVHEIEKEVALDKLRLIYEKVKFASMPEGDTVYEATPEDVEIQAAYAAPATTEEVPEKAEVDSAKEMPVKGKHDRKKLMSLYGEDAETQLCQVNVEKPMSLSEEGSRGSEDIESSQPPILEDRVRAFEHQASDDVAGEEIGVDVLAAMGLDQADDGEASLDEMLHEAASHTKPSAAVVIEPKVAVEPSAEQSIPNSIQENRLSQGQTRNVNDSQKKVFADTIKAGETLADIYARNNQQEDVAAKLKNGSVASIRGSIGINDKFLLVRDLFGGDQEWYDKTIRELDECADLDDAMLYIHDNFNWNPDSDGAKLLVDLLSRKLS